MDSAFAPAERATTEQLQHDIEAVVQSPVVSTLLNTASGLLAVLNEQRQLLALNEVFLRLLGVDDAHEALGLRPGEAVRCVHAHAGPGGCGTGRYCPTCGAAIAIMASLTSNQPEERKCALVVEHKGEQRELCFRVRSSPLKLGNRRFLLLYLQDITASERWSEMERIFFHDLNNLLTALRGWTDLLERQATPEMAAKVQQLCSRVGQEVALQQVLVREDLSGYQLTPQPVCVADLFAELATIFATHPAARGKRLEAGRAPATGLTTDLSLLLRVLTNMLTNAFEATPDGGEVKLWAEEQGAGIVFHVWNRAPIPPEIALRVFQRHFSTKAEYGRGLGTYAMKLVGERMLGGKVDFQTSPDEGTVFRLRVPTGS